MDIRINPALEKDLSLVLPLVRAYHEFEHLNSSDAERESAVRNLVQNSEYGGVWIIYCEGALAGYIALCRGYSIEFNGFDAFVDEFYLRVEFRGKGVGTRVLDLIKQEAQKLNVNALQLRSCAR